jgi:hypothetical protein
MATPIVAAIWVVVASMYRSAHGESADQAVEERASQVLARKPALWSIHLPNKAFVTDGRRHIIKHLHLRSRLYLDEHLLKEEDCLEDLYANHASFKEKYESCL